jgi:regulator of protease activity HflC (stomatin/prohibitin superfamily)
MRRLLIIGGTVVVLILIVWGVLSAAFLKRVDPGNVGIIVHYSANGKPTFTTVPTGTYTWINPFAGTAFVEYPTAQQSLVMVANGTEGEITGDDSVVCQDHNGVPVNIDVTLQWQVDSANAATLYLLRPNDPLTGSFNSDIESTLVRPVVRNAVTEACASYFWDSIGSQKPAIIADADKIIIPLLGSEGILVHTGNLTLGEVHYSGAQQQAINAKALAQQQAEQAQYLQQEAQYKAQAAVATAQGEAQSIAIINKQLQSSPEYLRYLIIKEWDGKLPSTMANGSNPILTPFQQP